MNKSEYIDWLSRHDIRPTANRLLITQALALQQHGPVSLSELADALPTIDKSNIFRTLSTFEQHHLVHVIYEDKTARYELCLSKDNDRDSDAHVHFYCECCHQTFCQNSIPIPVVPLPSGFELHSAVYIIKGICPKCSRKKAVNPTQTIF